MKVTKAYGLVAVAALAIALGACGGDDGDAAPAADSPLAKALSADMMADAEGSPVSSQAEADCWAGKIVSGVGEGRLTELGLTEANVGDMEDYDFTSDELSTIVTGMFDCVDVKAAFAGEFEEDFGAEGAACLADALDEDFVKEAMTSEFEGSEPSDEFFQAFLDIAAECDLPLG